MADKKSRKLEEFGVSGLKISGGRITQDYNTNLQGKSGVSIYEKMGDDPILGAYINTVRSILSQVSWTVVTDDEKTSDFIQENLFSNKTFNFNSWFPSAVTTCLTFGNSVSEKVYKKENGKIWIKKIALRAPDTLESWDITDGGDILGVRQLSFYQGFKSTYIPIEKCVHLRTNDYLNNPEGSSIFRSAYDSWYKLRNLEEIQAIGLERQLCGVPLIEVPVDIDVDGELYQSLITQAKSIRADEQAAVIMPAAEQTINGTNVKTGFGFSLVSSGGGATYNIQEAINYYRNNLAQSVQASFLLLGEQGGGSFALGVTKKEMFTVALKGILQKMTDLVNDQFITELLQLNPGLDQGAYLQPGAIDSPSLQELQNYVASMIGSGVIKPNGELEKHMLALADLPISYDE